MAYITLLREKYSKTGIFEALEKLKDIKYVVALALTCTYIRPCQFVALDAEPTDRHRRA